MTRSEEGTLNSELPIGRSRFIAAVLLFIAIGLTARLIHIQYFLSPQLAEWRTRQQNFIETIPARPGSFLDRNGRLLAGTLTRQSLFCIPKQIADPEQFALRLSEVVSLNADSLQERIEEHSEKSFLWIQRRLKQEDVEKIRNLDLQNGTWGFRAEYLRKYPQGRTRRPSPRPS